VTNCLVRKYSAFTEHAQCMSEYLDTCVKILNVYHWLARNDFNSNDGFRRRLWCIRVYFIISLKVVVSVLSKNMGGKYVTSRVLLI
jgi:hypothetical protein